MHLIHLACDHLSGATQPAVEHWLFPLVTLHFDRLMAITGLREHPDPNYGFTEFSFSSFVLRGSLTMFSRLALNSWPQVILLPQPRKHLAVHTRATALAAGWFLHHFHTIVRLRNEKVNVVSLRLTVNLANTHLSSHLLVRAAGVSSPAALCKLKHSALSGQKL